MPSSETARVLFDSIPASDPRSAGRGIGRVVTELLNSFQQIEGTPGIDTLGLTGSVSPSPTLGRHHCVPRLFWKATAPWLRHLIMQGTLRRAWLDSHCPIWHGCEPWAFPPAIPGRRRVLMMFDIIPLLLPELYVDRFRAGNRWFWKRRLPAIWSGAEAIVVNSHHVASMAHQRLGIPMDRFHVVPLGVDIPQTATVPCPVEGHFFLYVGASDARKNLPFLVRSFARFVQGRQDGFRLVLAGGMPSIDHEELRIVAAQAGISDQLILTGRIPDPELVALYRSARGFVFPSLMEGFGLPPLEAMAQGCPVLSSNTSCMPEVLGAHALYADPTSEIDFSLQMQALSSSTRTSERFESARIHAAQFNWGATAASILQVWEKI